VKLADEPTKASQKLNESMHYLNLATYERIRALEEQGNKEAAAALAQKTLADETTSRLQKVEAGAGSLERGWRSLADGAKGAWDAMLGIGRTKSIGDALGEAQTKLNEARAQAAKGGAYASLYGPSVKKGEQDVAALSRSALNAQEKAIADGEKARADAAQIGASDRLKKLSDEVISNADKRKKALKELDNDFKTLNKPTSGAEYDKLVANINDKYKDPKEAKGPREKAYQDDAATKMLENLRQQEASLKEQLSTDEKLTASEKERAKFTQLVADLKGKKQLTAEQQSLLAAQDTIKAQLDQNVAIEKQVEAKKEAARLDAQAKKDAEDLARTFNGINLAMESANEGRRDQYERTLATVGLGRRARAEVESEFGLRKDEQRNIRLATKAASDKGLLGSDEYKDEVDKIRASAEDARKDLQDFYAKDKANRENWVNGAREAFADYADYASDAASHTQEVFGNALKGVEDQLVNLFTGKKVDLKGLFDQTSSDAVRSVVKEQILGPLAKKAGDLLGDGGALSGLLDGGSKKGNERGSSASNPLYVRSADSFGAAANSSTFGSSSSSGGGLAGALGSIFGGFSNGTATTVANALPGDALDNLIKLQGGWGTIAGFAGGGDPPVGRISMVGERGPELFVPRQAGTIIPNDALGGSNVINITYVAQPGENRKTSAQNGRAFADQAQRYQRSNS
jgi:lambda family phage tail tape measure protein